MDRSAFIQLSASTRVLEKKLLNTRAFDRLIESNNLSDALRNLSDSVYQQFISKLEDPKDYEEALRAEELRTYAEYYKLCPDEKVVDLLTLKYCYHNLKVLAKEKILGEDFSNLIIDIEKFNIEKLREEIESSRKKFTDNEYLDALNKAEDIYEKTKNPQYIDIILDKLYFEKLKAIALELEVDFFKKYVEDLIDFSNINILLRCQRQGRDISFLKNVLIDGGNIEKSQIEQFFSKKIDEESPLFKNSNIYKPVKRGIEEYNRSGSLFVFEREKDNYFTEQMKDTRTISYGPEVIFAYLLAKDSEIKNLRFVLISKQNGLDASFIKERLRDTYV